MPQPEAIPAVYEDGFIRPLKPLLLANHQRVEIIILSERPSIQPKADRLQHLHEAVERWDAQAGHSTVREPTLFSRNEQQTRLDDEFDQILEEIRRYSQHDSEEVLSELVAEALNAMRSAC